MILNNIKVSSKIINRLLVFFTLVILVTNLDFKVNKVNAENWNDIDNLLEELEDFCSTFKYNPRCENYDNMVVLLNTSKCNNCNLDKINISGITLRGVSLDGASLEQANLEGTKILPKPDYIDNGKWMLYYSVLREANLKKINFKKATLSGVKLNGANLENANLEGANLSSKVFTYEHIARLGKIAKASVATDLENANLKGANLKNANLENANLRNANLENANLEGARLGGSNLCDATMPDGSISKEGCSSWSENKFK